MTMRRAPAFRPGRTKTGRILLERFLPPIPEGIAAAWLDDLKTDQPDGWILDPFGASPQLAIEIAQAGYRVLVAANNPINRFLLEIAADPPQQDELQAAFAELAASRKGEDRIEPHIRGLYQTFCQQCRQSIEAQAFLWEREAATPYGVIYACPYCGDNGERPATQADQELAAGFATSGLHRARALERIAPASDPDRHHAEEALSVYLPRAVYVLFTLINKVEGLGLPEIQKQHLRSLLLHACDRANTLWPFPTARARPKQLTIPPHFKENNIWKALEEAIGLFSNVDRKTELLIWPEVDLTGPGIVLFEGRLKDLADSLSELPILAVVTALPRPNQAFWTLSALWAGWLWGRDAVGPFKGVLRRRRYDWAWHTTALSAAFNHLSQSLAQTTTMFGLIGEAEPGFLSAALISAELNSFDLAGMALRAESTQAQLEWSLRKLRDLKTDDQQASGARGSNGSNILKNTPIHKELEELVTSSGKAYLLTRGEPALYIQMHASALDSLTQQHQLREPAVQPIEAVNWFNDALEKGLTYQKGFLRYEGSEKSLEIGQWWHREQAVGVIEREVIPLADRIEKSAVEYLQKFHGCSVESFDKALCAEFPGLLTPDPQLVMLCLDAYAEEIATESGEWQLRPQDHAAARHNDLVTIRSAVRVLAGRLGFTPEGEQPLQWLDKSREAAYSFYLFASATFGSTVLAEAKPLGIPVIVLPGGRANLALYKLHRNAHLNSIIEKHGWRFLKFRHVRRLIDNLLLDRENLEEQLGLDPLRDSTQQMRLL